jgi:hypothetical protein
MQLPRLTYNPDTSHWVAAMSDDVLGDFDLLIPGPSGGPDLERFLMVEPVLQVLEDLTFHTIYDLARRNRTDTPLFEAFSDISDLPPLPSFEEVMENGFDEEDQWTLSTVYFGLNRNSPSDEFSLHFWDTAYYAIYRLNKEAPEQSTLLGWSMDWDDN